ncbi:hypothetical protein VTK73DRAFT_9645 [Phialemonium thermophilum]|uniref:Uncharacterized protein n=1 Tax=Phialemonium thermophilum TaxID=223376 RepID=A0ABR3W1B8_9PEZI
MEKLEQARRKRGAAQGARGTGREGVRVKWQLYANLKPTRRAWVPPRATKHTHTYTEQGYQLLHAEYVYPAPVRYLRYTRKRRRDQSQQKSRNAQGREGAEWSAADRTRTSAFVSTNIGWTLWAGGTRRKERSGILQSGETTRPTKKRSDKGRRDGE